MYAAAPTAPRPRRRPALALVVLLVVLLAAGCGGGSAGGPVWQPGAGGGGTGAPVGSASATPAEKSISLSATGDIIMGNAPNRLPANGGKGFFDSVEKALEADLVMGNLEEPLTVDTGTGKCGANSTRCFQFRAPPEYAAHLRDAGFDLLNQANNHGYDYGPKGYANTQKALEKYDLAHTGAPDQITVVEVAGVKVAVAGFSSYVWSNSLVDIAEAKQVITKAAGMADLVVVQVHMGGEGSDKTRVRPGTEMFLGENRGDPVKFSKAMIDAGADLIVGHGPHVLRGMEFYKGRLIAYSLGNFAGGGNSLSNAGRLGWGGVLKVSLKPDGSWAGGSFVSTYMNSAGKPTMDRDDRGLGLVRQLTRSDFPKTGARFDDSGRISPPAQG
ncbi:Poly-gamma-glutamate biosynthesis protein CapA/YwtB (capsule formation), metallophosphatase superfamily [Micromonospora echinaurantiaca]|uniref:Poly-gamma-glutamate biosynthesis protein CapA/YwtB (Capsule formation), metallophosphatase superfamily n=1 Tax=Micromonospora echinaurantiaca TaxID=47857 RepID=A0A1C5K6B0_9ACTN|nr:CapA family protein [Micromonospora echinaurantiaca]SCG78247.1 Poly-gamma-glutamate biosynthesis protein CapA/YwtB (capsule formation), metallophosphatase superfamily [Micromonospora echinaurantiaca]